MVCTNAEWRRERFNFAIRVVQHKTETTRTGQQLSLSKYEQRGMFWILIEFFFLLRSVATHSQKELLTDWARLYTHFDENHLFSYTQSHSLTGDTKKQVRLLLRQFPHWSATTHFGRGSSTTWRRVKQILETDAINIRKYNVIQFLSVCDCRKIHKTRRFWVWLQTGRGRQRLCHIFSRSSSRRVRWGWLFDLIRVFVAAGWLVGGVVGSSEVNTLPLPRYGAALFLLLRKLPPPPYIHLPISLGTGVSAEYSSVVYAHKMTGEQSSERKNDRSSVSI